MFIRGIGQADFHPALDPGVGIYIDDVYYGQLYGDTLDLSDVDRVEVLRGPQGTLFGRNTEGGAIRIFTTQPKGDYSGYASVGYGSYNHEQFKGAMDIPIIQDKLAMRVAVGVDNKDGYVDPDRFRLQEPGPGGGHQRGGPGQAANANFLAGLIFGAPPGLYKYVRSRRRRRRPTARPANSAARTRPTITDRCCSRRPRTSRFC